MEGRARGHPAGYKSPYVQVLVPGTCEHELVLKRGVGWNEGSRDEITLDYSGEP